MPTQLAGSLAAATSSASEAGVLSREAYDVLTKLDDDLVAVLATGAIRLIRSAWFLAQPDDFRMPFRQKLEELERGGVSPSPLLSPDEAMRLIKRGDRSAGVVSHAWLSPGNPDPAGERVRVVRATLKERSYLMAFFFECVPSPLERHTLTRITSLIPDRPRVHSYGSLYQHPPVDFRSTGMRTSEENVAFGHAIDVMGALCEFATQAQTLDLRQICSYSYRVRASSSV